VLMLFVLGLFIVKGPLKWALLAVTILSVLLSWGRNFMPFTVFFLDYIPLYSKFRTMGTEAPPLVLGTSRVHVSSRP